MRKVAIVQSNYIPWKGYFDIIAAVDEFILYDDTQFTKNDWRNRNRIKTPKGVEWISIPVGANINRRIRDVRLPATSWREKHWRTLEVNYRRARCFDEVAAHIEPIYLKGQHAFLSAFNRQLIEAVCAYLGITTAITSSRDYSLVEGKTARLADLCVQAGATEYLSGPSAKGYLDEEAFAGRGIKLGWMDYSGYPEYPQLWGEFAHGVAILDLLFNCGKDSPRFMKHVRS